MPVLSAELTQRLDAAGSFVVKLPLTDPRAADATGGRIWQHFREGQGFVFAGLIEQPTKVPPDALELRGPELMSELLYTNTLLNRTYTNAPINTIVDDLLTGTGWSRVGSLTDTVTIRFDGESILQAILIVLEQRGYHVRSIVSEQSGTLTRELEIGAFGAHQNNLLTNPGFEVDTTGWVANGAGVVITQVTNERRFGIGSVKLSGATGVVQRMATNPGLVLAGNTAGRKFTLTGWFKAPNAVGRVLDFGMFASGGAAPNEYIVRDQITTYADGWVKVSASGSISESDRTQLQPFIGSFNAVSGDEYFWDGLSMEEHPLTLAPVLTNGNADDLMLSDRALAAIPENGFRVEETTSDLWNWILPLGAGEGVAQLTLEHSTRTSPFTIDPVVGPGGETLYGLKDAASITDFGQRERLFVAKDIAPLSTSKASLEAAADALYDLASAQLIRWKDRQIAYTISAIGLDPSVLPGDTVSVRWRGYAKRWDNELVYLDVDEDLFVLERRTVWDDTGAQRDELTVSDIDRGVQTTDSVLIGRLEQTARGFRTHVQTGVSVYTAGPGMEDVTATKNYIFTIFIPDNIAQLLRCQLRVRPRAIRSPVDVSATDGAGTSGTKATPIGGAAVPTSSSELHKHTYGSIAADVAWTDPSRKHDVILFRSGGLQTFEIGSDGGPTAGNLETEAEQAGSHSHTVTIPGHTHPIHDHTTPAHSHALTFGIFEGGSPGSIGIVIDSIDRTVALGGPWSAAVTIDITAYLLDGDGVVNHGDHVIQFTSDALGRIEVWQDWTVLAAAIPVV